MYLPLKIRIKRARANAIRFQTLHGGVDMTQPEVPKESILKRLNTRHIVDCTEGFIVTEAGFITMALLPRDARYCQGLLVIPGIDDRNQFGYLVLGEGFAPYHSMEISVERAAVDAQGAWVKASILEQAFGGRTQLKHAAESAPWYLFSRIEDASHAGLCSWGIDSFLRRACMRRVCQLTGLPRFVIRLAGGYGLRVTASTLLRKRQFHTVNHRMLNH